MRRFLAWLVLSLFSFSLISPALLADDDSNLPACCRRAGHHRCSMMSGQGGATGVQLRAAPCPNFPGVHVAPVAGKMAGAARTSQAVFMGMAAPVATPAQAQNLFSNSYSREAQKRGPPVTLS